MSLIFFKSFLWIVLLKYKPFFLLFHAVSSVNLLLYKQLPSKVKILSLVLIVYFIGLQLYSEGKLYSSTSLISNYCIAYRNNIVSRRNIRAHPGTRRGYFWSSGQYCRTNRSPELWFGRARFYWPYRYHYRQAPEHNPIISNYAPYRYYLLVHLSCWNWLKTLVA